MSDEEQPTALTGDRPRVLHVIGSLAFGGIETALIHLFRQQAQSGVRHEVLVTTGKDGPVARELERLGIPLHILPISSGRFDWPARFRRFLLEHGPYAAVHSHIYLYSAVVVAAAKWAGVRVRIAHCHNARSRGERPSAKRRLLRQAAIPWLKIFATHRLGVSEAATEEIAGSGWKRQSNAAVVPLGFDFSGADGATQRAEALTAKMGLPQGVPVVGHAGRFHPIKNHQFLLKAFKQLKERRSEAHLVLAGEGPLLEDIQEQARALGIADSVHFPGFIDDVAALMAAFDLFVLPSTSEGLGLVCLEAQAVGTRCLVSERVPREVAVVPGMVEYLPLEIGPAEWAERMEALLAEPFVRTSRKDVLEQSQFGLAQARRALDGIYLGGAADHHAASPVEEAAPPAPRLQYR